MSEALAAFRSADATDRIAVEYLLHSNGLPTAGVAEMFADDPSQFVVAYDGDVLVATAALEECGDHALLRSVAVSATCQRRGLGTALVDYTMSQAAARGFDGLYLLTMTAEDYFPRFGFERVARDAVPASIAQTVEFTSACPASAVTMHKSLRSVR
jgi:amino-acid N-acetyltransferase